MECQQRELVDPFRGVSTGKLVVNGSVVACGGAGKLEDLITIEDDGSLQVKSSVEVGGQSETTVQVRLPTRTGDARVLIDD
jgi:hypothetical protein